MPFYCTQNGYLIASELGAISIEPRMRPVKLPESKFWFLNKIHEGYVPEEDVFELTVLPLDTVPYGRHVKVEHTDLELGRRMARHILQTYLDKSELTPEAKRFFETAVKEINM